MATTDTSEGGLEALIRAARERGEIRRRGLEGLRPGASRRLKHDGFLNATQPEAVEALGIGERRTGAAAVPAPAPGRDHQARRDRRAAERRQARAASRRPVLRHADPRQRQGRRAVRRQHLQRHAPAALQQDETQAALDLRLFINGLPIATFELKNSLTKQTVEDAVEQYKRDRDPKELLFQFGRCVVHFAVDDPKVRMCTHLKGKASWFLPFNKGWNDGAGNPPNPDGLKTDYLWKQVLTPRSLTEILENYAQIVEEGRQAGKKKRRAGLPALPPARRGAQAPGRRREARAPGERYLIQHSAGRARATRSPGWPTNWSG